MQQQRREVERSEEDERARQQQPRRRGSENHSTDAEHVDNVDKFWGKVQHTQQVNFHAEEVDENNILNLVEDAKYNNKLNKTSSLQQEKPTFWAYNGFYVIHPKAPTKLWWDFFVAGFIVYSVLLVPFKLGFSVENGTLDVIDVFVDVVFFFDMILAFNQGYYDGDSTILVLNKCKIAKHYAKTWFAIDFFSTFPTYRVAKALATAGSEADATRSFQLVRAVRLIRLLKLARLLKLRRLTKWMREAEINPGILRIFGLVTRILFVAHLFACLWHGVGVESLDIYGQAWIIEFGAISETLAGQYVMSLYFTVATMMAVGYGDIYATTGLERGFAMFTQVIGALVFGWILATVAVFNESSDPRTAEITRRTKRLKAFMKDRDLPKAIKVEILKAFEYRHKHKSVFDEISVLNSVSSTLGNKLVAEGYRKIINLIPILTHADISLCGLLCREMRPMHMQQDSIIYKPDRMSPGLIMVKGGIAAAFAAVLEASTTVNDAAGDASDAANGAASSKYAVAPAEKGGRDDFSFPESTGTTNRGFPPEALIGVFDEGSHFGHDCSMFLSEQRQHSKVTMRVAKACDLFLVSGEALQRLSTISEKFRTYLVNDALDLRSRLDAGILNQRENPSTFEALYNGMSEDHETISKMNGTKSTQSRYDDVPVVARTIPAVVAAEETTDPKQKRRLSMSIAKQASNRMLDRNISFDQADEKREKRALSKRATSINAAVLPKAEEEQEEEGENQVKKISRPTKYSCERLVVSLAVGEADKYIIPDDSRYVVTLETISSLFDKGFIHPLLGAKMKFDLLIAMLILWSVVVLPYRIAFDDLPTWEFAPGAYVFEWCLDFLFFVDICFSFRTCYEQSHTQIYVASSSKIATNYLRSWFTIDVLSTLPLDLIIEAIIGSTSAGSGDDGKTDLEVLKLIRIIRLVRLVKLARLFKLGKVAKSISDYIDNPQLLQLSSLLMMIVFISHLLGCFWFLLSPYNITDPKNTWWGGTMLAGTRRDHYLASVYWSFTTMTTVGYGDIIPVNTAERLYACAAMIGGATIFGYVIGNIAAMTMQSDIATLRKKEKINSVIGYMKEKNIGVSLRRKVEDYLEFYYENCQSITDTSLMDELPDALQSKVSEYMHGATVDKFSKSLFKNIRREAATKIISKLRTEVFVRGDILFRENEIGSSMYLVNKGIVLCIKSYQTPEEKVVRRMIQGTHFGQYSMLKGDIPHPYTAVATQSTVILAMSRANVGIMVENDAMLSEELERLFTQQVEFSITKAQRVALTGQDDTAFSVAPRINRILLAMSPQLQRLRAMSEEGHLRDKQRSPAALVTESKGNAETAETAELST